MNNTTTPGGLSANDRAEAIRFFKYLQFLLPNANISGITDDALNDHYKNFPGDAIVIDTRAANAESDHEKALRDHLQTLRDEDDARQKEAARDLRINEAEKVVGEQSIKELLERADEIKKTGAAEENADAVAKLDDESVQP